MPRSIESLTPIRSIASMDAHAGKEQEMRFETALRRTAIALVLISVMTVRTGSPAVAGMRETSRSPSVTFVSLSLPEQATLVSFNHIKPEAEVGYLMFDYTIILPEEGYRWLNYFMTGASIPLTEQRRVPVSISLDMLGSILLGPSFRPVGGFGFTLCMSISRAFLIGGGNAIVLSGTPIGSFWWARTGPEDFEMSDSQLFNVGLTFAHLDKVALTANLTVAENFLDPGFSAILANTVIIRADAAFIESSDEPILTIFIGYISN
jgi:hypothetical protein